MNTQEQRRRFCQAFLRTMDPEEAARGLGADGYALLSSRSVLRQLDRLRTAGTDALRREDVLRRLAQLAFGRANGAALLALRPGEADPRTLDLSAVSELRVTDKGGVEVKLADRVRALETLYHLLADRDGAGGAEDLYQALADAAGQLEGGDGDGA